MNTSRFKALGPWLAEGKYIWLALGVNALALIVALLPGTGEPVIRLAGLVLQVLGIATVIWGITETRSLFGYPPILGKTKAWLQRFPLFGRSVATSASGISISTSLGKVRAFGTFGAGDNPTIEARLEALEKNINCEMRNNYLFERTASDVRHKRTN